MKIIHTSDIHLFSPLTSKLPPELARQRRRELLSSFSRLCTHAKETGVSAMIIAGDLFDSENVSRRNIETVISIFEKSAKITFFYLPGNHEKTALLESGAALPANLKIFGEGWTYFNIGDVTVAGRSGGGKEIFDTLLLREDGINVAVLHGELRDRCSDGGVIGAKDAAGKNIDYLALGHYHKYSEAPLDRRGVAVYSGTPEGRGFDETGILGYSLIDVEGEEITHRFVPFAKRLLIERSIDIGGAVGQSDVKRLIAKGIADVDGTSLLRAVLTGGRDISLKYDTEWLREQFADRFFYFEIKDKTRISCRAEDFTYDKSLRGEFIRLALSDGSLSDGERSAVIEIGLSALAGEDIGGEMP